MWMRKENVGGEDAVIHLIDRNLGMFSSFPLHNRQDEGAGPGTPLTGLLMHSGTLSRGFPAFLAFSLQALLG